MSDKWYKKDGLKVLSLFDGISCGAVALDKANVSVSKYSAYESDYNAIKVSLKNYPQMDRHDSEEDIDYNDYNDYDLLIGRSPITADLDNKNDSCGIKEYGLFCQYAETLERCGIPYFIYENSANINEDFKNDISEILGVQPILINSKMVSAQNRERLYWTNIPYNELPREKGVVIKKILEDNPGERYFVNNKNVTYTEKIDKLLRYKVHQIAYLENEQYKVYSRTGKGAEMYANNGKYNLYLLDDDRIRRLTPIESERMQTLPDNYTDCDLFDSNRYKLISENPTVDVFAFFFKELQEVHAIAPNEDLDADIGYNLDSQKGINVLSVFDGMSCGMLAMLEAGLKINNYYAYEIDEAAVKTSLYNFPSICHLGDVFDADFTEYEGIDYLVGGSPCTYWSIAQSPDKRETTASGLGWDLFSQYLRALHEAKPKFFIYENNKSMTRDIYNSISEAFGFEPIMINSALVSAQNRQRYYWVGKRNEDGTYSKVDIAQPEDEKILLKDILEGNEWTVARDKAFVVTTHEGAIRDYFKKSQSNIAFSKISPINTTLGGTKSHCLKAQYNKNAGRNFFGDNGFDATGVIEMVSSESESFSLEPVCVASRGRYVEKDSPETRQNLEVRKNKTNTLTTVQKDNYVCEPICANSRTNGIQPSMTNRIYDINGKSTVVTTGWHTNIAEPLAVSFVGDRDKRTVGIMQKSYCLMANPNSEGLKGAIVPVIPCYNDKSTEDFKEGFDGLSNKWSRDISCREKSYTLTATYDGACAWNTLERKQRTMIAEPVNETSFGKAHALTANARHTRMKNFIGNDFQLSSGVAERINKPVKCFVYPQKDGNQSLSKGYRVYSCEGKAVTVCAGAGGMGAKTGLYAIPTQYDENRPVKAFSYSDMREHDVYKVMDNKIVIKGKTYNIKLEDGYYIIRKLTVKECMRLQTVPEWYDFSCASDSQAYKMLGNGWTVKVIKHLIESTLK